MSDIYMRVTKSSGVSFYCTSIVEEGIAEIPIGDAPEGFFNPFGSQYLLEFFEYSAEAPLVEFSVNSQIYDGIEFAFCQGFGLTSIITINIF
jgi:hypothetical protein